MSFCRPIVHLDSSEARIGQRWDFHPGRCDAVLSCDGTTLRSEANGSDGRRMYESSAPLEALGWMEGKVKESGPGARWVGYIGYDLGRLFEKVPSRARDDLGLPLFRFSLQGASSAERAPFTESTRPAKAQVLGSTFNRSGYERAVERSIEYIGAGDVFQVNLSQRFEIGDVPTPARIRARLLERGGAHYGALLEYEDFALVSHSPELFLRVTPEGASRKRRILTRPIKGTRPRVAGMQEELRKSAKDQAELNMIIDLERNDLGRICEIGSVRVVEPRTIEAHPTVFHGVAGVEGMLRDEVALVDILRATFPGGSITGAPKIRAMEIIEELEPVRRGTYCGAIGYVAGDGSMEFNVAIRTIIMKDGRAYVSVGGGIVADSRPSEEYDETLVKARAMFEALGVMGVMGEGSEWRKG